MPNLEEMLRSPHAEKLVNNREKLGYLIEAPETQKIFSLLNQNANGNLELAAENAAKGDSTQLMSAIKQLMKNPEAAFLIEQMKNKLK